MTKITFHITGEVHFDDLFDTESETPAEEESATKDHDWLYIDYTVPGDNSRPQNITGMKRDKANWQITFEPIDIGKPEMLDHWTINCHGDGRADHTTRDKILSYYADRVDMNNSTQDEIVFDSPVPTTVEFGYVKRGKFKREIRWSRIKRHV